MHLRNIIKHGIRCDTLIDCCEVSHVYVLTYTTKNYDNVTVYIARRSKCSLGLVSEYFVILYCRTGVRLMHCIV